MKQIIQNYQTGELKLVEVPIPFCSANNILVKNIASLIRPFIYFFYRYIIRLGFLDGKAGFIYHFLQGLWYPFLIDVKYLELKRKKKRII